MLAAVVANEDLVANRRFKLGTRRRRTFNPAAPQDRGSRARRTDVQRTDTLWYIKPSEARLEDILYPDPCPTMHPVV